MSQIPGKKPAAVEVPEIVLNSTNSTDSTASTCFTPVNGNTDCDMFRTPTNQEIQISHESLGLTTTKMRPMREVLDEMETDGAWGNLRSVAKTDIGYRLVVFLYGKGYYSDLPAQERVRRVKRCISTNGGNRKRLREIALSCQSDQIPKRNDGFNSYFSMAYAALVFFRQPGANGGFPVEAYHRIQFSRNCYIVAVCMWLTVKLQRDYPERKQLPIDVGYAGRRYVIGTLEGLEDRVIRNKGGNAIQLCEKIIGVDKSDEFVKANLNFGNYIENQGYQELQRSILDSSLDMGHHGLVTRFGTCQNFREKSRHYEGRCGYLLYDEDNVDCEGVFIDTEKGEDFDPERLRLLKKWVAWHQKVSERKEEYDRKMSDMADVCDGDDGDEISANDDGEENTGSGESRDESEEGKHAMVMLGTLTAEEKRLYMLWNWWPSMPLVLVSFEYLVACRCQVFFLQSKLDPKVCNTALRNEALACECAFPDHAENTFYLQH